MAFAASTSSTPDSSLEGSFYIQKQKYQVTLTATTLKWMREGGKAKDEVNVLVSEILSVTTETGTSKEDGKGCLKVVYAKHKKKWLLRQTGTVFTGSTDTCSHWCKTLQGYLDTNGHRPRNALVLINPISGRSKGPKQYTEKVAPVFQAAALKTDVKITESADHVREIIRTYELSSIDSLIVVGGDGMYHLVADALVQRNMREAGLDINDTEKDIPELSLPIGIIPCGTGNGIAMGCYGNYDVETAALASVIGGIQRNNVFGIWSAGQFMVYSTLLHGGGYLADLIYDTEKRRSMGVWRYPVVIGGRIFRSSARSMDVSIEYKTPNLPDLKCNAKIKGLETGAGNTEEGVLKTTDDKTDMREQQWQTYHGRCVGMSVFVSDVFGYRETKNPAHKSISRCLLMKEYGRLHFFRFFKLLMTFNPDALHDDNLDHYPFLEYKVKVNNPEEQNGRANYLNVDGEPFKLKAPEYHCKIFPSKVRLFSSVPDDFMLTI